ncbi:MAG: hypothetical protein K2N06_05400 [Oscillospiraceae bacterium]|nr:hypothetical protein [Oscillospiraceae bacterium]
MQIRCINCGAIQRFKYSEANVNSLIAFGWSSYGGELYCPECVEKTNDVTGLVFLGAENTRAVIDLECRKNNSNE